jgi:hypothetical protein
VRRRAFIAGIGSAAAWPLMARAKERKPVGPMVVSAQQQAQRSPPMIGMLWSANPDTPSH